MQHDTLGAGPVLVAMEKAPAARASYGLKEEDNPENREDAWRAVVAHPLLAFSTGTVCTTKRFTGKL